MAKLNKLSILVLLIVFGCKKSDEIVKKEVLVKSEITVPTNGNSGKMQNLYVGCGYNYNLNQKEVILNNPENREIEQIKNLLAYSGIPMNFEIFSADISNAAALIIDNKRYIIYDPKLFLFTDKLSNTYWSSMSILAHEIGHHLSGHTLLHGNDSHKNELEADKYSGFLLYKMGAKLEDATISMRMLADENDSESHPAKNKRLLAIENGWKEASAQRYQSAIPPPPADDKNFTSEGYVKDEFFKEEIIGEIELGAENFGGVINAYIYPIQEGIIIDVEKKGYEGDLRAGNFNREPSELNMTITVQLTKDYISPYGDVTKNGSRIKYNLMDYYHMTHADLSWLENLMVPGRKISFKSFYYGYEVEDIFYIKKLTR